MRQRLKRSVRDFGSVGIAVSLFVVNRFVRVDLVRIYSSRIGHLCYNLDNYHYLVRGDVRARGRWPIVILDERIANLDVLRRIQRVLPGSYLSGWVGRVARQLIGAGPLQRFVVPWAELHPIHSRIGLSDPWVLVGPQEMKAIHSAVGMTDAPYILLHNRDAAYLSKMGEDGNRHEARDFDFDDFREAIQSIHGLGVQSIRIGALQANSYVGENLLELSGYQRKEEWDLPLVAGAMFLVTGNTGLAQLSTLLRKPHLYVNYLPLRLDHMVSFSVDSVLLPKRLRDIGSGNFLTLGETISVCAKWDIHYDGDYFTDAGLQIVDNSPELIASAVCEMISRIRGSWSETPEDVALQFRAISLFGETEDSAYVFHGLRIRFAASYLSEFPELVAE